MGLDMYLKVKYPHKPQNKLEAINEEVNKGTTTKLTGACGGLFGVAPADNGCEEIGYWRKAYEVCNLILGTIDSYLGAEEDNCVDFLITEKEVDTILEAAEEKVEEIKSAYENYNPDNPDGGEDPDLDIGLLYDWESTIDFFARAKDIYIKYPDAEIYFEQWY